MDNPLDNDDLKAAQPAPRPVPDTSPETVPDTSSATPIADQAAEPKGRGGGKPPKKRANVALYVGIVLVVLAAAGGGGYYFSQKLLPSMAGKTESAAGTEAAAGPLAPYAKGSIAHLVTYASPRTIDNIPFVDRDRKPMHLSDFKGQVVVLNVWATWCAPCRFEMPTLAHLQTLYADKGVKVLPISVDEDKKFDDVKSFMDVQEPLGVYVDTTFAAPSKLGVSGMPATLILDKQGRAVARLDGEASWDTPEVRALIDKLLAE